MGEYVNALCVINLFHVTSPCLKYDKLAITHSSFALPLF